MILRQKKLTLVVSEAPGKCSLLKLGRNFEQSGKIRELFQTNVTYYFSYIKINCLLFDQMDQVFSLKKLEILGNGGENAENSWNFVRKSGNHVRPSNQ